MRILFLHYAFPGPFRYLAESFAALPDAVVLFASEYGRRDLLIPGVDRVELGTPKRKIVQGPRSPLVDAGRDLQMAYLRGSQTAQALRNVKGAGFIPDMICATAAMGNSLFLRDVFPDSFLVAYAENYAPADGGPEEPEGLGHTPQRVRNLLQVHGLVDCDLAVVATQWQRKRFPDWLGKDMTVLPQCVDTGFFSPSGAAAAGAETVTFSGHGLETPSEWSRLAGTIRTLLKIRPACRIEILAPGMGQERLAALRQRAAAEWGEQAGRVRLHGFSSSDVYRQTLRASSLYVHMASLPLLPVGLLESMSCGCPVLAPHTGPSGEVIREGENGFTGDFASPASTAGRIAELLERGPRLRSVGEAARRFVMEGYSLARTMPENRTRLLHAYERWLGARSRHVNHKKSMVLNERREG